jgi:hypothetical protein
MRIIVLLIVPFLAAAPAAAAQPAAQGKGGYAVTSVRAAPQPAAGGRLTAEQPFAEDALVARRTLVPLADDLNLDIGLFSVTGAFLKDKGGRGREPMTGTGSRETRVAAVGFSLSV